jgi:hypothetical protein
VSGRSWARQLNGVLNRKLLLNHQHRRFQCLALRVDRGSYIYIE